MNEYHENVDKVLQDLRKILIEDRPKTHGDAGLFAHVFAGMLRPYIHGLLTSGRGLQDLDAYNIMGMMKMARAAVGGPVPHYEHPLDLAGYAVLRAAHIRPQDLLATEQPFMQALREQEPEPVVTNTPHPGEEARRDRSEPVEAQPDLDPEPVEHALTAEQMRDIHRAMSGQDRAQEEAQDIIRDQDEATAALRRAVDSLEGRQVPRRPESGPVE